MTITLNNLKDTSQVKKDILSVVFVVGGKIEFSSSAIYIPHSNMAIELVKLQKMVKLKTFKGIVVIDNILHSIWTYKTGDLK